MGRHSLKFFRLSEHAEAPVKGSDGAAGLDLSSAHDAIVPAEGKAVVRTDLQIAVPKGTYGRIAPRSGLAAVYHLDVGAGVIDPDYRGNVCVVLFNHSKEDFVVCRGDRVAQIICEKVVAPTLEESSEKFEKTARGQNGLGFRRK